MHQEPRKTQKTQSDFNEARINKEVNPTGERVDENAENIARFLQSCWRVNATAARIALLRGDHLDGASQASSNIRGFPTGRVRRSLSTRAHERNADTSFDIAAALPPNAISQEAIAPGRVSLIRELASVRAHSADHRQCAVASLFSRINTATEAHVLLSSSASIRHERDTLRGREAPGHLPSATTLATSSLKRG